jgi:acetyl esterase/lipase
MKTINHIILTGLCAIFFALNATAQSNNVPQIEPLIKGGNPRVVNKPLLMGSIDVKNIKHKFLNVPYGHVSKTQFVDIYLPDKGKKPYPVIVAIHGGAFFMGDSRMKNDIQPMLAGLKKGYAVVSVSYRLSGEATFPRAVNDVKAVVRFVRANAKKYNFNSNKIVAWGGSAGGNMVLMLGTTGYVNNLNGDNTENLQYSSAVQAVVDWFGPCDFRKFDEQFQSQGLKKYNSSIGDDSAESWYIGQNVFKDTTFTMKANPMTYIPGLDVKKSPYFLIEHGGKDTTVPIQQSINLYHALKAKLGADKVKYKELPTAGHATPEFGMPDNLKVVFDFLDKVFKNKK